MTVLITVEGEIKYVQKHPHGDVHIAMRKYA